MTAFGRDCWFRGRVVATYTYGIDDGGSGNDHGDLLTVVYSNDPASTPSTTFAYDRRGRQKTVTRNSITTTLWYNDADQLISETYAGGTLGNLLVTNRLDVFLRKSELTAKAGGTVLGSTIASGYDNASRLNFVSDGMYHQLRVSYQFTAGQPDYASVGVHHAPHDHQDV